MKAVINSSLLSRLAPKNKEYDVYDEKLKGFVIRVNPSGKMQYVCQYARGRRINIGSASILTPAQARDAAKTILADAVRGILPQSAMEKQKDTMPTFSSYLEHHYKPWVEANRKSGKSSVTRIQTNFLKLLGGKLLSEITSLQLEQWRTHRIQAGKKANTINRDLIGLKAALSKAVEWELLASHPLSKLKLSKVDHYSKVRYLNKDEEVKLRQAIDDREENLKTARERGNLWRKSRGYQEMPHLQDQAFVDHMKPMILLSLNTGLRRGELFSLTWQDIDFPQALLTVRGETAKSGKSRHVPLNSEALHALEAWRQQSQDAGLIFPSLRTGQRLDNVKKAWASLLKLAEISQFRWHDMRHHFASKLVMVGVDLNTVRELLGHSDIKMTLIYAHLAPEHKANAVAKLVQPGFLSTS